MYAGNKSNARPSVRAHELRGLQITVHPDGEDAKVTVHTNEGSLDLCIPFAQIANAESEIRQAALLMVYRKAMKKDQGRDALGEMIKTALRPNGVGVILDKQTGDSLFVLQFEDHAPVVVRLTQEDVHMTSDEYYKALKRAAN